MSYVVGFITGHSVPGCTGLSPAHRDFQRRSAAPEQNWLPYNFPWQETFPFRKPQNLLIASWRNVRHYLQSRRPAFREQHRAGVVALVSKYDAVILVAGSCGLELLNNLDLPSETRRRLHVFAYGPVSRRRPEVASCFLVQGERDLISRWFHRQVDARFPCHHMGYLAAAETVRLFDSFYSRVIAS
jgi:hypothetical protein